ncbi:hypothetical protein ACFQ4Z_07780 [Oceanobacillus oncorhynchi subsp. oncorhynchi]|uniref:hypothetical protein n=1 Tax=Oceanobacillus oncorhynchi TaxID=545501 RepID=UPI003633DB57
MKRSIEISLSLLGGLAYVFSVGMYMETIDKAYGEPNHLSGLLEAFTVGFGIMGIAIIVCILAIIWFSGVKKSKAAGIMLLVFAAATLLITYGGAFIGAFFYLIAGILGIVRKVKTD